MASPLVPPRCTCISDKSRQTTLTCWFWHFCSCRRSNLPTPRTPFWIFWICSGSRHQQLHFSFCQFGNQNMNFRFCAQTASSAWRINMLSICANFFCLSVIYNSFSSCYYALLLVNELRMRQCKTVKKQNVRRVFFLWDYFQGLFL